MDALPRSLAVMAAVLVVVCLVPAAPGSDGAGTMDGLMLYEVHPYDPKGVSLYNYGPTAVDLMDYIIADQPTIESKNEGWLTFTESIIVEPGEFVVIAEEVRDDDIFTSRGDAYAIGTNGIELNGRFNLNGSTGDDVYLMTSDGTIIDAVCYGSKTISDEDLWVGEPAARSSDTILQRHGTVDTDTADDWILYVPGRTDLSFDPGYTIDAVVTPFLFPDSGGIPIYQQLESATESVLINMYLLTNANVYALLADLAGRGVEVCLLLEGEPTAIGNVTSQADYIRTLVEAGGQVRLIGVGDDGVRDRYDVDHAKYAIVDMDTVILTSENWTSDNTNGRLTDASEIYGSDGNGNRGWGVVVESTEYAAYMRNVFDADYSTIYGDVVDFVDLYPNSRTVTLTYDPPEDAVFQSYQAEVTPFLSPDSSLEATQYYISAAQERVYSQQQSLGSDLQDPSADSPLNTMKSKAGDGLDVRLLISTNVSGYQDVSDTINATSLVKAGVLKSPYVHNKGLVCDDVAIVSSVNWTTNSFTNNREAGVAILSAQVADYFARAFLADFDQCYTYDGYRIDMTGIGTGYVSGVETTLQVTVRPDDYDGLTFNWDFGDGSEPLTSGVPRIAHVFQGAGEYILTVSLTDEDGYVVGSAELAYTVSAGSDDGFGLDIDPDGDLYYLVPVLVVVLAIAVAALGSHRGKRRRSTGRR